MKVLVVGDSFVPARVFAGVFDALTPDHEIRYADIHEPVDFEASTPSERSISEYVGTPHEMSELLADADVLVVHGAPVTEEVMRAGSRLQLLGCARGGPVNVDLAAATRLGLPVAVAPGKNAPAVADLTIAFILMLARGIQTSTAFLAENGGRMGSNFEGARFVGSELAGATLGLLGYGNVGVQVATRARAFDMRVVAYDPHVANGGDVTLVERLDDVLGQADFLSLHARSTPETQEIIDSTAFAAMKPGAWLINTARETLVDERALGAALDGGRLAGAALDVLKPPPPGVRHPLIDHPRVLITPHIGGATRETLTRGAQMMADAVGAFAAGQRVPFLANPEIQTGPPQA